MTKSNQRVVFRRETGTSHTYRIEKMEGMSSIEIGERHDTAYVDHRVTEPDIEDYIRSNPEVAVVVQGSGRTR